MAGRTYSIGEVAKTLKLDGKNNSTVRLWTETFADWLSPLARPSKGQLRLYTEEDVRCLTFIRDLRRQHISYDEVRKRLVARRASPPETATGADIADPAPVLKPGAVVGIEELSQLLSPVFEVSEALRRFLRESDYSVGIHLELGRLASSVESLNAKLDLLRYDLETLGGELKVTTPSQAKGEVREARESISPAPGSSEARLLAHEEEGLDRFNRSDRSDRSHGAAVSLERVSAPHLTGSAKPTGEELGAQESLNEYGLRLIPARLAEYSPGAFKLCRHCGSTTKPLGVTPTDRIVLRCIQCHERLVVPIARLEAEMGIKRGFWSRLWQLLRTPFSRR